ASQTATTSAAAQKAKRRTHSRPEISDEQKQEINEAFEPFDTDKDGASRYALGFDMKKAEVLTVLRDNDKGGHGPMEFEDFAKIMAKEIGDRLEDDQLQAMIEESDLDQDGEISEQEFYAIMQDNA
ncbi:EF-hand, partial [Hymenopellis radicata]